MLHTLQQMLAPAVMERVTLLLNHVLGTEPVAMQHLLPHVGKVVRIDAEAWPPVLPSLPPMGWRITPAGLLEWCGLDTVAGAELRLTVAAHNPAALALQLAGGERPRVEVSGDAQFASDVNWLMQNLRWDLAADLERVLPGPVAAALVRAGSAFARGMQGTVQGLESMRERWRGRQGG